MPPVTITPVLAAFEYGSMEQARAAWLAVRDSGGFTHLSAWSMMSPERDRFIVGLVGETERQAQVDRAAELLMAQPGCRGNYLLPDPMADMMVHRRYSALAVELRKWKQAHPDAADEDRVQLRHEVSSDEPRPFSDD